MLGWFLLGNWLQSPACILWELVLMLFRVLSLIRPSSILLCADILQREKQNRCMLHSLRHFQILGGLSWNWGLCHHWLKLTLWVLRNSGTLSETYTHREASVIVLGFFFKTSQCKLGIFMPLPLKTYWWYPSIPGPVGYINTHIKEDSTKNNHWPCRKRRGFLIAQWSDRDTKGIEDKP